MNLSSSEISSILKEQIEKFDLEAKVEEIGKVLGRAVGDGVKAISNASKADAAAIVQSALSSDSRLAGVGGAVLGII